MTKKSSQLINLKLDTHLKSIRDEPGYTWYGRSDSNSIIHMKNVCSDIFNLYRTISGRRGDFTKNLT